MNAAADSCKPADGAVTRHAAAASADSSARSPSPPSEHREPARQAPSDWHSVLQSNIYLPKLREGETYAPPSPASELVDVENDMEDVVDLLEEDDQQRYMSAAAYEQIALREASNHDIISALKQCHASTLPEDRLDADEMDKCIREQTGGPHPHIYGAKWSGRLHKHARSG